MLYFEKFSVTFLSKYFTYLSMCQDFIIHTKNQQITASAHNQYSVQHSNLLSSLL